MVNRYMKARRLEIEINTMLRRLSSLRFDFEQQGRSATRISAKIEELRSSRRELIQMKKEAEERKQVLLLRAFRVPKMEKNSEVPTIVLSSDSD